MTLKMEAKAEVIGVELKAKARSANEWAKELERRDRKGATSKEGKKGNLKREGDSNMEIPGKKKARMEDLELERKSDIEKI